MIDRLNGCALDMPRPGKMGENVPGRGVGPNTFDFQTPNFFDLI
jgi:hypothetical protein